MITRHVNQHFLSLASSLALLSFSRTQKYHKVGLCSLHNSSCLEMHTLPYTKSIKHLSCTGRGRTQAPTLVKPISKVCRRSAAQLMQSKTSIQCNAVDLRIHSADPRHSNYAEGGNAGILCIPMRGLSFNFTSQT